MWKKNSKKPVYEVEKSVPDNEAVPLLKETTSLWADQAIPGADEAVLNNVSQADKVHHEGKIFQPTSFQETKKIVDELLKDRIIVIDFSKLPKRERTRTIDFVTGVTYAHNGHFNKINKQIYQFDLQ
ncbi:uncharacterized protein DUF552 [Entomoplasma freundtii]|uniref:Cell division protein SepF n=1 Tax=Entomoplasma freundtii TaxID=74700 RepID=A0A2K8NV51_9MOLU|nr:cell division protein SepF [Entomoplasma freundtii]ATZ16513.1 cell division protein SepF [Entomoplasma freundtii]TDY56043.1 uncharacterized protein DUF552 [Entomoplasma freundtii]